MNSIKKLAGQTAIYGMGTVVPKLLNYAILTFFYTRVFGQENYGTVTEIYAYVVIIMVILTFGMETGFFRFSRGEKDIRKVYSHAFLVVFILSILWVILVQVFLDPISTRIRYEDHPEYVKWFAWIIALDAIVAIPFAKLRQEERPRRFAMLKISMVLVNIALVMIFLLLFPWMKKQLNIELPEWLYNPETGVGYVFIANLITSSVMFLLMIPELKDLVFSFDRRLLMKMIRFSSPLVLVGIAGAINDVGDKIILKFMLPDQDTALGTVGVYGASYRLAVIMTLYIQMFRYAFEPFMFSIYGKKDDMKTYASVMNYFVILGLVLFLVVTFYMDGIKYFLGENFHSGLGVVPVILIANLFLGIYYSLSVWYKVSDRTQYAAVMATIGSVITLTINFLLIPRLGYWASAWAHISCYGTMVVISYFWGRKIYPVPYPVWKILGWIAAALLLFALSEVLKPDQLVWRLLLNTVLLLAYGIVVAWREKELVRLILVRTGIKN